MLISIFKSSECRRTCLQILALCAETNVEVSIAAAVETLLHIWEGVLRRHTYIIASCRFAFLCPSVGGKYCFAIEGLQRKKYNLAKIRRQEDVSTIV